MKNYTKIHVLDEARVELHDSLNLTGSEISINNLTAGASIPFVHSHKQNEEVYFIVKGSGKVIIDEEEIKLETGDWLRIAPEAKRQFFASSKEGISYICIQTKSNSLEEFTANDAIIY